MPTEQDIDPSRLEAGRRDTDIQCMRSISFYGVGALIALLYGELIFYVMDLASLGTVTDTAAGALVWHVVCMASMELFMALSFLVERKNKTSVLTSVVFACSRTALMAVFTVVVLLVVGLCGMGRGWK